MLFFAIKYLFKLYIFWCVFIYNKIKRLKYHVHKKRMFMNKIKSIVAMILIMSTLSTQEILPRHGHGGWGWGGFGLGLALSSPFWWGGGYGYPYYPRYRYWDDEYYYRRRPYRYEYDRAYLRGKQAGLRQAKYESKKPIGRRYYEEDEENYEDVE
jgi:hypothetical protein